MPIAYVKDKGPFRHCGDCAYFEAERDMRLGFCDLNVPGDPHPAVNRGDTPCAGFKPRDNVLTYYGGMGPLETLEAALRDCHAMCANGELDWGAVLEVLYRYGGSCLLPRAKANNVAYSSPDETGTGCFIPPSRTKDWLKW